MQNVHARTRMHMQARARARTRAQNVCTRMRMYMQTQVGYRLDTPVVQLLQHWRYRCIPCCYGVVTVLSLGVDVFCLEIDWNFM